MTVITEANKTKARELTAQLTLDEKIAIVHAAGLFRNGNAERLGIPPLRMDDGPMGVRAELHNDNWAPLYNTRDYVTYLPSGSAVASTWNPDLARMTGEVLGEEARGRGKDVILGPSINIKRSPLCGRNFEYMSEDPVLTAAQGVAYIQGVQESDVAACAKHYAVNSQETDRLDVDETVSERALREIYLPAFEAAVQDGGVLSVMGAYNLVNGTKCCEHKQLLDDILRDEYGFDGFVVSDWSAVRDTKASAEVGMDIELSVTPNFDDYYFANPLKKAVEDGDVKESDVDGKVERVIAVMDALHMLGDAHASRKPGRYATLDHAAKALDIARESIVLLKNDAHLLPLDERNMTRLLVIGANADRIHSNGGGSAVIKALHEVSPLLGLNGELGGNVEIEYALGYDAKQINQDESWQEESLENSKGSDAKDVNRARELRDEAVSKARAYAAAGDPVVFIGGLDHEHDLEAATAPTCACRRARTSSSKRSTRRGAPISGATPSTIGATWCRPSATATASATPNAWSPACRWTTVVSKTRRSWPAIRTSATRSVLTTRPRRSPPTSWARSKTSTISNGPRKWTWSAGTTIRAWTLRRASPPCATT